AHAHARPDALHRQRDPRPELSRGRAASEGERTRRAWASAGLGGIEMVRTRLVMATVIALALGLATGAGGLGLWKARDISAPFPAVLRDAGTNDLRCPGPGLDPPAGGWAPWAFDED